MTDAQLNTLIEFFLDEFRSDPGGVGDWFAQNGEDIDTFYDSVMAAARNRLTTNETCTSATPDTCNRHQDGGK